MALSLAVNVYSLDSYKIGQKEERPDKDATIAARFARMCVCVCVCVCVWYVYLCVCVCLVCACVCVCVVSCVCRESMRAEGVVLWRRTLCAWAWGHKSAKVLSTEPGKVHVLAIILASFLS